MTDFFLDRLECQLVQAERRLAPRRRRRRWARKGFLIPVLIVATGVPALAATQPWHPSLGRPKLHDQPHGTSNTPIPPDVVSAYAVLRRPQTGSDRGPIAQKLFRYVGQEFFGVRLQSVRLITLAPGHHVLVVSSRGVGQAPKGGSELKQPLCMVFSSGGSCTGYRQAVTRGVMLFGGSTIFGLVPDGVARVVIDFGTLGKKSAPVRDNGFFIKRAPLTTRHVPGPPNGPTPQPMKTTAPFSVHWLDRDGKDIGPPGHR